MELQAICKQVNVFQDPSDAWNHNSTESLRYYVFSYTYVTVMKFIL